MKSDNISSHTWGYYASLLNNNEKKYEVKKVILQKNKKIPLQSHSKCCKHWIICSGKGKFQLEDKYIILSGNAHIFIPIDSKHSIENITDEEIDIIEIKMGEQIDDADVIVYEDK
jgi:mannose-6-phosphate isomerase-like protein (cupin superfamily)